MRELKSSDRNVLAVSDARSSTEIELYYRDPTTREEALYQSRLVQRKGSKILVRAAATRLEFGLEIVTGFRAGDFGVDGEPVSSDPGAGNYYANWKDLLREGAADILRLLAMTVFEGARVVAGADSEIIDDVEAAEETVPLAKSSEGS